MGAPKNNKNAETISLEYARDLAQRGLNTVSDECFYLSSVAEQCETYRQQFEYVLKKFNDDDVVFNTIKRLYNKCESIVMEKTGKGEITPALGIFVLKAYHGLMETSKVEQTSDLTISGANLKDLVKFTDE